MNPKESSVQKNSVEQGLETKVPGYTETDRFFKTIGEVSSAIGIPPHVLRFWESKFLDIKPHKRKGGHRYYSERDVEIIYEIKKLLYEEGYTIKGAQKYLREKRFMQSSNAVANQQNLFNSAEEEIIPEQDNTPSVQSTSSITTFKNANTNLSSEQTSEISKNNSDIDPRAVRALLRELESIKKLLEKSN